MKMHPGQRENKEKKEREENLLVIQRLMRIVNLLVIQRLTRIAYLLLEEKKEKKEKVKGKEMEKESLLVTLRLMKTAFLATLKSKMIAHLLLKAKTSLF